MEHDAVIIGGGITGLALAYQLQRAGQPCLLLEAERVGGVIKTKYAQGFTLEQGPNVFLDKADFAPFLEELGLGGEGMIYPCVPRFGQYLWFGGRPQAVPKSLPAFLRSPLFSAADKLRLGLLPLRLLWRLPAPAAEDESIEIFLTRMLGRGAVANLVDPALKGIYGGNASELSARAVFPLLWQTAQQGGGLRSYIAARRQSGGRSRRRGQMFVVRGGGAALVQRLTEKLGQGQILQAAALKLQRRGQGGFEVVTDRAGTISCRRVFVATAGPSSAAYLEGLAPALAEQLRRLRYAALAVVHCALGRDAPIQRGGFGVLFPAGLSSRLLGVMYNSELFPHLAPEGRQLLTVCLGGVGAEEVCAWTDEKLGETVRAELDQKLGLKPDEILALQRWPRAIPQYELGHHRLAAEMQALERDLPGLHFAGVDRGGVAVPERVRFARLQCAA